MKTFIGLSLFLILISQAFALTPEERQERRRQLREEMHQRLRQGMLQDFDPTAMMNDMSRLMDAMVEDSMQEMQELSRLVPGASDALSGTRLGIRSNIVTEWTESATGRSLLVSPADKSAKLDVQVNGQVISIKTEFSQTSQGARMAGQSTQTQLVPGDCDGDQVKMEAKDNGLVLFFPYKNKTSPKPDERTPLRGNSNDIQT